MVCVMVVLYVGEAQLGPWQSHPLCRALTSQAQAQASLLLGLQRLVQSLPHCKLPQERQHLMQQLVQPFLSFVMLSPDVAGEHCPVCIQPACCVDFYCAKSCLALPALTCPAPHCPALPLSALPCFVWPSLRLMMFPSCSSCDVLCLCPSCVK